MKDRRASNELILQHIGSLPLQARSNDMDNVDNVEKLVAEIYERSSKLWHLCVPNAQHQGVPGPRGPAGPDDPRPYTPLLSQLGGVIATLEGVEEALDTLAESQTTPYAMSMMGRKLQRQQTSPAVPVPPPPTSSITGEPWKASS